MKNFLQDGDIIVIASAPETVDSGEFIKVGELYGVAQHAAVTTGEVPLKRTGVFELPKATGVWAQGAKLYWDVSAKNFTTDASKTAVNAAAFAAAASDDTVGQVMLGDGNGGVKIARGQHTTVTAADTIVTGLATVSSVVASYDTDPADANTYVSATIGDQAGSPAAGSIIIKTWKQSGTDPTPIAADAFSKKVNWIAVGT